MASTYPNPASLKTPLVGTSSVQIAPQNLSRSGLYVFNLSGSVIWVCPAQSTDQSPLAASVTGGSTAILPSSGLVFQEFTGAMNAIAVSGTSNQVTVWEFYHGGPTSVISAGGASAGGSGGGSGVPEAPLDGNVYGRQSATWVQLTPAANAAPFDAMAYNGMQVNGGMEVSQENGVNVISLVSGGLKYIVDGFQAVFFGTGTIEAAAQVGTANSPPGFLNSLTMNCTVANSLAGANDGQWMQFAIEGYRSLRLMWGTVSALPVTIGFWVFSSITGTMAVAIQSGAGGRSYVTDVPVTASTWQYKTVTIPGDLSGTWNTTNTAGLIIYFVFGAGSGRKITANAWFAGFGIASAATTNFFATPGQVYISGVVVLPGTQAPTAARSSLIMRPYDQELATCQRYFRMWGLGAKGIWLSGSSCRIAEQLPITMRANPTTTLTTTTPAIELWGSTPFTAAGATITTNSSQTGFVDVVINGFSASAVYGQPAYIMPANGNIVKVDARF